MAERADVWVGKDEVGGVPVAAAQGRRAAAALAARGDRRDRAAALADASARTARRAVFIQDRDTSDVWLLDLDEPRPRRSGSRPAASRCRTGRTPSRGSRPTARRSRTPTRATSGSSPPRGGPPRRLLEADDPVWIDDATLRRQRRARRHHAARRRRRRRPVAAPARRDRRPRRRVGARRSRPTAPRSRTSSRRAPTSTAPRSASPTLAGGAVHARHRHAADAGPRAGVVAGRRDARVRLRALGRVGAARRRPRRDRRAAADRPTAPTTASRPGTRTATASPSRAASATASASRSSTPRSGAVRELAPGGAYGAPHWTAGGDADRDLRGPRDAAGAARRASLRRRAAPRTLLAPAPLAVRARRTSRPRTSSSARATGSRSPASCSARATRPERRSPAIVYPHGGPTDAYADDWDGHAQYFVDKGYAWLAVNFRGSTGYGRDFERANHGVWGVEDVWDCLAAADHLRVARLGRRRPARDLRRQLRLLHGAARGHRRPRAPLPLRGREVRRLRHPHVVGAGRPRRRPGPRADDGPPAQRARGVPRRLPVPPARERRARRC